MIALQLYILGQQVEMFDDEAVNLSQSIQDVKDIDKIFTEFTQTFSVPASKLNNIIFKHFYNSDIIDSPDQPEVNSYDGRKKIDAELYLNYKPFKKGKIKLEGSSLKLNKPHTYRLTFFGNTVNLKDLLGDAKLSSLELLDKFEFDYTDANLLASLTTGIDITCKGVVYDKAIITPLITTEQRLIYDSSAATETTDTLANLYYDSGSSLGGVNSAQLKPALSVYAIVKAIEDQYFIANGFTFSQDFFSKNNASFYDLYLWLHNKVGNLFEDQINTVKFDGLRTLSTGGKYDPLISLFGGTFKTLDRSFDPRSNLQVVTPNSQTLKYSILVYVDGELFKSFDDLVGSSGRLEVGDFPTNESIHAELKTGDVGRYTLTWNIDRTRDLQWPFGSETRTRVLTQTIDVGTDKIL